MAVDSFDLIHSLAHVAYKQCPDYDGDILEYHDQSQRAKRFLSIHEIRPSDNFFLNGRALPKHLVDMLTEKVDKNLIGTRDASLIPKDHSYFTEVKDFCRRWNIPDQARLNFEGLLRGNLRFPVLLLQNSSHAHGKSFDKMTEFGDLSWIRRMLQSADLDMDDVVILNIFPFFPTYRLQNMSEQRRRVALAESFRLTENFLKAFKPSVLVSCQCATNGYPGNLFSVFDNRLARELSSSIARAKRYGLRTVTIDGGADGKIRARFIQSAAHHLVY